MALAVARQERHALAEQRADPDRTGRRAVPGVDLVAADIVQLGQFVDAGAADDGQCDVFHHSFIA